MTRVNLYFIHACNPEDLDEEFDLVVAARDAKEAMLIWQDHFALRDDLDLFAGDLIAPDTAEVSLDPDFLNMARVWLIQPSGKPGPLPWGGVAGTPAAGGMLHLVGYVRPYS